LEKQKVKSTCDTQTPLTFEGDVMMNIKGFEEMGEGSCSIFFLSAIYVMFSLILGLRTQSTPTKIDLHMK